MLDRYLRRTSSSVRRPRCLCLQVSAMAAAADSEMGTSMLAAAAAEEQAEEERQGVEGDDPVGVRAASGGASGSG